MTKRGCVLVTKTAAATKLHRLIGDGGSVPVGLFMAYANAHYYATRDPLGAGGDFITAPEISQIFGELVGLWCADLWLRAGSPGPCAWVELGPGRGTLARDALRSMARFGFAPEVHFVETSPVLRDLQSASVPQARFHGDVASLPTDRPMIVVANEFFDALPIRQLVRTPDGWRERVVGMADGRFVPGAGAVPMEAAVPPTMREAAVGSIIEASPASVAVLRGLADGIARQGGALLTIDYGYPLSAPGDTLQAMAAHGFADPFEDVGNRDLTAHVDFGALAAAGRGAGLSAHGPVGQGAFLTALGLAERTAALAARHPERADAIQAASARLAEDGQMGQLFKALALTAPAWPVPEGFAR
jgi:NADH dehydrogenase [ubiquinone] 1 alpha subcomplex assembly factor 7